MILFINKKIYKINFLQIFTIIENISIYNMNNININKNLKLIFNSTSEKS